MARMCSLAFRAILCLEDHTTRSIRFPLPGHAGPAVCSQSVARRRSQTHRSPGKTIYRDALSVR